MPTSPLWEPSTLLIEKAFASADQRERCIGIIHPTDVPHETFSLELASSVNAGIQLLFALYEPSTLAIAAVGLVSPFLLYRNVVTLDYIFVPHRLRRRHIGTDFTRLICDFFAKDKIAVRICVQSSNQHALSCARRASFVEQCRFMMHIPPDTKVISLDPHEVHTAAIKLRSHFRSISK